MRSADPKIHQGHGIISYHRTRRTSIGSLVKFSSNPLNGKLLEKQKSSAEKEYKEKSSNKIDYLDASRRGVGLTAVDERVPADPYRQRPCEDGYVSALVQSKTRRMDGGKIPVQDGHPVDVSSAANGNHTQGGSEHLRCDHAIGTTVRRDHRSVNVCQLTKQQTRPTILSVRGWLR